VRLLYSVLLTLATPLILLRLLVRARRHPAYLRNVGERFGLYGSSPTRPLIWVHAVSVGETRAAEPLVKALAATHPEYQILLTHMTPTGRETGEQLFGSTLMRCYLPYDLPACVAAFLRHFRPRIGILMETELWPNLIHASRSAGVPLYLVNARLSERSARGYARAPGLTRDALAALAAVGAQTEADAERLRSLGARSVVVTGNLKFDRGPQPHDIELGTRLRELFLGRAPHASGDAPHNEGKRAVVLAASTREGEEELVLDAVSKLPEHVLIVIVPRHPQRFAAVARLLQVRGLRFRRRSDARPVGLETRVVLGDSMGELFAYYLACDVAFVGGSLLPLGGQNLLEACAAGVPVVIGPHTFNFVEATRLAVDAGAALQVADATELGIALATLLGDNAQRTSMGAAGRALMVQHQGATARTLALFAFPAR
jgi:3-deoxy-D-manno-octulosonic-acid transferase